jgi:hypothetical protein
MRVAQLNGIVWLPGGRAESANCQPEGCETLSTKYHCQWQRPTAREAAAVRSGSVTRKRNADSPGLGAGGPSNRASALSAYFAAAFGVNFRIRLRVHWHAG